jgi:inorganic pyrophosphatase
MRGAPRFSPWRPHPWHGLSIGPEPPRLVHAYIEITPFDLVKYEIDKDSGYLKVDRPQRTSSLPPALYGFLPRTYAGKRVGAQMPGATDGDHDPLDVCVISERPIARAEILLEARVIGGVPMLDADVADDKILAILSTDAVWAAVDDVAELPQPMVDRIVHYFATYKQLPGEPPRHVVGAVYGRDHAFAVIRAAMDDYAELVPPA